ncbi:hypothetical protein CANCADRAFT_31994 [Tortispora caseinolytica NRRL Y-17796]|uniref:Major facilitator superfamily (MFS) profile domain-containing protein n=1 Tax=Tortispora caseinolytica NRRL Y-17796 TaxID=767744 RepID=A0A1E4THS9_9ASCO|nr:hypothetical protein CANCADRAFT_31994 [Tortispora caseinolytica NRRL Y-17796]
MTSSVVEKDTDIIEPTRTNSSEVFETDQPITKTKSSVLADLERSISAGIHEDTARASSKKRYFILFILCLSLLVTSIEQTIVTTSMPAIAEDLGGSSSQYSWVGTIYVICSAAVIPTAANISEIFGRKVVLLACLTIFLVGSAVSGAATSMGMLIAGRAVQGLGGGAVNCLCYMLSADISTIKERGIYTGLLGSTWAVSSAIGPLLGAALTTHVTWRWIFYINLPVGVPVLILIYMFIHLKHESVQLKKGLYSLDILGTITLTSATILLLLGLSWGGVSFPWTSATVICPLVFSVVGYTLFVLIELHASRPVFPMRLLNGRTKAAGYITNFFQGITYMGLCFFLPIWFEAVKGQNTMHAAYSLMSFVVPIGFGSGIGCVLISLLGSYQLIIWVSFAASTLFNGLMIMLGVDSKPAFFFTILVLLGLFLGVCFQTPAIPIQCVIEDEDVGPCNSAYIMTKLIGMSFSIAISGVALANEMDRLLDTPTYAPLKGLVRGADLTSVLADGQLTFAGENVDLARELYAHSFTALFIFYTVVSGIAFLCSLPIQKHEMPDRIQSAQTAL